MPPELPNDGEESIEFRLSNEVARRLAERIIRPDFLDSKTWSVFRSSKNYEDLIEKGRIEIAVDIGSKLTARRYSGSSYLWTKKMVEDIHVRVPKGKPVEVSGVAISTMEYFMRKMRGTFRIRLGKSHRFYDPEPLGRILGFLLPRSIRKRVFEPYFEDLKQDRIERRKYAKSEFAKRVVDMLLYLRLMVTYVESLLCWAGDIFMKAAPVLKWLLTGSTLGK